MTEETLDQVVRGVQKENQDIQEQRDSQVFMDQRVNWEFLDETAGQDWMDHVEIWVHKEDLAIEVLQDLLGPVGRMEIMGWMDFKVRRVNEVTLLGYPARMENGVILDSLDQMA